MPYKGYYAIRSDGDGDLVAVVADNEEISEELANDLRIVVSGRMNVHKGKDGWFTKESTDPDSFPQVLERKNILIKKNTKIHC